jgi:hypothetical protein
MNSYIKALVLAVFATGLFSGLALATVSAGWPASTEGKNIDEGLNKAIFGVEPSGLYWDTGNSRLLGVGDEGDVFAIDLNDTSKAKTWRFSGDLEGITMAGNAPYLLDENGYIYKVDLTDSGKKLQTWDIGAFVPEVGGGAGGEGLAFAQISGNWYFLVGSQDGGVIHVFDLSCTVPEEKGTFVSGSGRTDASDMYYENGLLYVLYDGNRAVEVLKLEGAAADVKATIVYEYTSTPADDAEGFALAPSSGPTRTVYLAYDYGNSGRVLSYSEFPNLSYSGGNTNVEEPNNHDNHSDYDDNQGVVVGNSDSDRREGEIVVIVENEEREDGVDYHSLDPSTDRDGIIVDYSGEDDGDYSIEYSDGTHEMYSAFSFETDEQSKITPLLDTGYFLVTSKKNIAVVNAYAGKTVAKTRIEKISEKKVKNWIKSLDL